PPPLSPLSLHDALPIFHRFPSGPLVMSKGLVSPGVAGSVYSVTFPAGVTFPTLSVSVNHRSPSGPAAIAPAPSLTGYSLTAPLRSEEHTSELQSRSDLV